MTFKHCVSLGILATSTLIGGPALSSDLGRVERAGVSEAGKTDTLSVADRSFLKKAAIGGMSEVEMGKLAVQKATRDDVKKFGQRMIDDHTKANDKLKELAKRKGFTPPDKLDEEHQKMLDDMGKMSGMAFDEHYVKMMVEDHDTDVGEFKKEKDKADDGEVKAFAKETLPTLESHQKAIKAIDAKMKADAKTPKKTK